METKIKNVIENYQCSGCVSGCDISCFESCSTGGIGCGKHRAGTLGSGIGSFFLGMPKGFNRLGYDNNLKPHIYERFKDSDWTYDKFNIPAWKFLSKDGHTFVRGMMPRINQTFIHIFLENCVDKINCFELNQNDIDTMD